jgi:hypothetical protein
VKPAEDAGRTQPMEECYLLQKVTLIEWLTKYGDKEAFLLKRQSFGKTAHRVTCTWFSLSLVRI